MILCEFMLKILGIKTEIFQLFFPNNLKGHKNIYFNLPYVIYKVTIF